VRETEAVARLSHPGIVAIYSVGEAQGSPYFAMEFVDGATLQQSLDAIRTA
jgi:serine/threonine protein kinase